MPLRNGQCKQCPTHQVRSEHCLWLPPCHCDRAIVSAWHSLICRQSVQLPATQAALALTRWPHAHHVCCMAQPRLFFARDWQPFALPVSSGSWCCDGCGVSQSDAQCLTALASTPLDATPPHRYRDSGLARVVDALKQSTGAVRLSPRQGVVSPRPRRQR